MKLHACLPVLLLLTGCAFIHSKTLRTTDSKGVVTETTTATGYSLFDANNSLAKFRNQSGPSSPTNFAAGTYVSQLNETSSTSNVVSILNAMGGLVGQAAAAAAK